MAKRKGLYELLNGGSSKRRGLYEALTEDSSSNSNPAAMIFEFLALLFIFAAYFIYKFIVTHITAIIISVTTIAIITIIVFITKKILQTNNPLELNDKGVSLLNEGEYDKASELFKKALSLDPSRAEIYFNQGLCNYNKGEYYEAIDYFTEAIEHKEDSDFYYYRGATYIDIKDYDKALSDLNYALEINPNDTNTKYLLEKYIPYKGDDIYLDIYLNSEEARNGGYKNFEITHLETCKFCKGSGRLDDEQCSVCDGSGRQSIKRTISVNIPPDVIEGKKIRIKNEGNAGLNGGENGDLYFIAHLQSIKNDESENKKEKDLKLESDINYTKEENTNILDINIMTCDADELWKLNFLSVDKINEIIKKRNEGIIWYDINTFASDLNLQPHEIIQLQDILNFPLKQNSKRGRKIDF